MTPTQSTAEQLEVTQADRDLWKYLLDAPKSQCTMMDTCDPATAELQAIARHRILAIQATEARMAAAVDAERERCASEADNFAPIMTDEQILRCPRAVRLHGPLNYCPDCPEGDQCELPK